MNISIAPSSLTSNKLESLKEYIKTKFKYDFVASAVVFLVAIPLCLGIAMASGAPLISGLISGIIGGIIVGALSNSQVSVSGPAAGMAALIITGISELGGFDTFLLALTIAGILQALIGFVRAGFAADYIPSNIVQGLLCAIGVLLIAKQLPLAFTQSSDLIRLQELITYASDQKLSFRGLLLHHFNAGATLITLVGFAVFFYAKRTTISFFKKIPTPIIVVLVGVIMNEIFILSHSVLAQNNLSLVSIPDIDITTNLLKNLQHPNWAALGNGQVYFYAITIALVASIETLLNIKAGEKLDKSRRYSSKDRELVAQGIGNAVSGLIGGLPITSVIVRTSVNIQSGCKTKVSTILHGLFLILALVSFSALINRIPIATLATILIYTGYKLTHPTIYLEVYHQGTDRFLPFIATVIGIVFFNLLEGILIGLAISLFYILKANSQTRLDIVKEIYPTGAINRLILPQQVSFLNKASLTLELEAIPKNSQLMIDARNVTYIDKEIIELIKEFKNEQAPIKNIAINLIGLQSHYEIHNFIDFINVTTYSIQATLKPFQVINILKEGNLRLLKDQRINRNIQFDIEQTALSQHPIAVVLGCIDSRVPVETIFDMSCGDLFIARVAGNVVNTDIIASIEYACKIVGAKLILVLGHTRCGAIQAACSNLSPGGNLPTLLAKIKPAILAETQITDNRNGDNSKFTDHVMKLNIINTIDNIYNDSEILSSMIDNDEIGIIGAVYNVETGEVKFNYYSGVENCINNKTSKKLELKSKILINEANQFRVKI